MKRFLSSLFGQVLLAIVLGVLLGQFAAEWAVPLKPLGDGFIKLIKMLIAPIIFTTVVAGISGMGDMKKVGRVGGMALLYFEAVTTLALIIGLVVANLLTPGAGVSRRRGRARRQVRRPLRRGGAGHRAGGLAAAHYSEHLCRGLRRGGHPAGATHRTAVGLRARPAGRTRPAGHPPAARAGAHVLQHRHDCDSARAAGRLRCHGLHHRQVWARVACGHGEAAGLCFPHLRAVYHLRARLDRPAGRLQPLEDPPLPPGGIAHCRRHLLVGGRRCPA